MMIVLEIHGSMLADYLLAHVHVILRIFSTDMEESVMWI